MNWTAVFCGLASAALFGASTPAAKALVGSVHAAVLAGLLYCGAGVGVAVIRRALPWIVSRAPEVKVTRSEEPEDGCLWIYGTDNQQTIGLHVRRDGNICPEPIKHVLRRSGSALFGKVQAERTDERCEVAS
jgi:hypothetical protein